MKFIVPPNFYVINQDANPPMQLEPFYNYGDFEIVHLKRGQPLEDIPTEGNDLYGITAYTEDYPMAEIIAKFLKRRDAKCEIVLGGCYATYSPGDVNYEMFDHVISGNGEWFIESQFGKLPAVKVGCQNIHWDERSFKHFIKYNPNYHRLSDNSYTVRMSYGCRNKCFFCANSKWNGIDFRSIGKITVQLDYLRNHGVNNLRILDEVFTVHPEFETICRLLKEYDFRWNIQDRIDHLTEYDCAVLKKSGCNRIQVGVESFDDSIRRKLNKHLFDDQILNGIKIATDAGLQLDAFIMLGLPYDTEYTIRKTVDRALELFGKENIRPDIFVPYAGTVIGDSPEKHNLRVLTDDSRYYSTFAFQNEHGRIVAVPKQITDVSSWEKLLFETLYELAPDIVRNVFDNPIKEWHTDYEMYGM